MYNNEVEKLLDLKIELILPVTAADQEYLNLKYMKLLIISLKSLTIIALVSDILFGLFALGSGHRIPVETIVWVACTALILILLLIILYK